MGMSRTAADLIGFIIYNNKKEKGVIITKKKIYLKLKTNA